MVEISAELYLEVANCSCETCGKVTTDDWEHDNSRPHTHDQLTHDAELVTQMPPYSYTASFAYTDWKNKHMKVTHLTVLLVHHWKTKLTTNRQTESQVYI